MFPDGWHLTEDVDDFLARAGDFLSSRPALHTMPLTITERLRTHGAGAYGVDAPVLGRLEQAGEVRAVFYGVHRLTLTSLTAEQADSLAAHLARRGQHRRRLTGVNADDDTATAFTAAWRRQTGATATPHGRIRLYRLGRLTPPEPLPAGRGRVAGEQDLEQVIRWCGAFAEAVGEVPAVDAGSWAGSRFADKEFTFWETPDGTPVSFAGTTPMVAGQVRVDPVHTPAHLRGHGYAGAVTAEVSRAARAAGAKEVVLFADAANPTSNSLYQRLGYLPVTDFALYDFSYDTPEAG